uniref:Ig-like domain-containing protein n=1 Tax=Pelodiscus sinensis TaxID=13735 RepID=K7F2R1_PELSI
LGILLALLCQGLVCSPAAQLSQEQVYRIHVAAHVTVQQGLCVLLPCHFTADFEFPRPVYKYWFLRGADWHSSVPVASTNPNRPLQEPRGRIHLAGEPRNDCSLRVSDREHYYFCLEKGESKYSYLEIQPLVNVTAQLSQGQVYRIQVAPHVTVQQGLCVLLPCNFTANFKSPGPVYKYWFLRDTNWHRSVPVVSTNPDRPPKEPRGRIRLAGEAEDDCSLSISDVRAEDRDRYYFRFEKGESKYSYLEIQPLVNVTELRDQPVLRVPEVLKPGQPVNVTCQAPGTCSGTPPQITWTGGFDSTAMDVSEPQGNGSVSYSSVLHFTPTLAHDGKELGCTVTYPAVGVSTRRALRLHV